ncbi:insulinase family protein [Phaeovibrio sulfidiphilus]|uniref:Insulinase family protein n=1 Tax=Phaeovibrio sulfidiphilus TaxID=1220600 RepID=A0A8J6YNC8_9PROT|nr:pitrilysin family protein [Phaeovibrio sulfidiphilus]MBE1237963.1 insulinase family protein [Phaeovibrio sulfidiphilus]
MIENVRTTRLPSGLVVATDRLDTVESVTVNVWVNAGARHEPAEINGISHFLEHMAFKGTHTRSARQIAEEIEAVGGSLNAYTSRENTAYYAKVLKADQGLALELLADILRNSTFDEEELAREREVVVQEILWAIDTPDDIVFDYFQETAFPNQALGRPVLGTVPVVRSFTQDTVRDYMRNTYSADRMIISACGPVDHDAFVARVAEQFGDFPVTAAPSIEPPAFHSGDWREERDIEQVHMVMGFEGVSYTDPDYYTAAVLSTLHGGGMSSRLFQEIREKRGLVYSIYSYVSSHLDSGIYAVYAGTGQNEVSELIPVLCEETVRVADTLEDGEVERAKAQLKASVLMGLESPSSRAETLGRQIQIYGHPVSSKEMVEKVEAVTRESVAACARRIFSTKPVTAFVGPLSRVESHDSILARLGHTAGA